MLTQLGRTEAHSGFQQLRRPQGILGSQSPALSGSRLCSSMASSRPQGSCATEVFTFISKGWVILAFSSAHEGLGWNEQTARGASSSRGRG